MLVTPTHTVDYIRDNKYLAFIKILLSDLRVHYISTPFRIVMTSCCSLVTLIENMHTGKVKR